VPLTKKGLNIMDLPIISSFVQSSVNAALAEYVAPKSLTLDLKDLLVGDDFKKDTSGRGIVMVRIKSARGFKEGDGGIKGLKRGSSDPYVAVGWAKFGKPVWSTRVIIGEMNPVWEETTFILVGPEEFNAGERLRVQLWDSDRGSADDDLGRIEVDLKELIRSSQSNDKMWDRHDGLQALEGDDAMPGTLDWSVGYFGKTRIQKEQLSLQDQESGIKSIQQLENTVSEDTERKMREAGGRNESLETAQQKAQDLKTRESIIFIQTHWGLYLY
jgi:Ca2+-dependent lipid-binding protein